ncbi:hypothetical protein [Marispirochaeta sp.]|uniref:hypothetical protein n=1 Tax=Marispirochaeta sp. TaxID=2038653 RepID=UPI0029C88AA2|nr:hypothetical protein [Marispirochaeta sp.]
MLNIQSKKQVLSRKIRWGVLAVSTGFFLFFSRIISVHSICPIGGFELFFERMGKLVLPCKPRKLRIPEQISRFLRWFKYGALAAVLNVSAAGCAV